MKMRPQFVKILGGCLMLGLIKCRVCDEDIEVYDAEKVIIHYTTCSKCKEANDGPDGMDTDLTFRPDWREQ